MSMKDLLRKTVSAPTMNRSWEEDFDLENGMYQCRCIQCGEWFFGHKMRTTCKECKQEKVVST